MSLHPNFPTNPYEILDPAVRWFPAEEALREKGGYEKLLPPLVAGLREEVKKWRDEGYAGASETSKALLRWWFAEEHPVAQADGTVRNFRYYFAQREAVETVVWLYDVARARSKYDLLRHDKLGRVSPNMFEEEWLRLVLKMATGSGKTKVMSLVLAWSYFHRLYEADSGLARNFLLITPNIIVLERIKADFAGLKIFYQDPVLPDNGYAGQSWRDDFQVTLHFQDQIGTVAQSGNIFLTNIHRVYENDIHEVSADDEDTTEYFLGAKPVTKTNDSTVDLGIIVRDIDELMIINDEAHHIHDPKLAWAKSIEDIHNRLKQKGTGLALQLDVTATPRNNRGEIFVQTVCDYPLVEAIKQGIVKTPVVPDRESLDKLQEQASKIFSEQYRDYIELGVTEWRKAYEELKPTGKKAILFVMTDDTTNCDDVASYLESRHADLKGAVLTIHTNKSGEITETKSGKNDEELQLLRKQANEIDSAESPYKVIVSVLMLKEGWDVRNVTTIVGLRPFTADSKVLPEQTLGRGLRRMFFGTDVREKVSVLGTPAFMEFIESIKVEGVELPTVGMGGGTGVSAPLVIEVDRGNPHKDIATLDIRVPLLSSRLYREYQSVAELEPSRFEFVPLKLKSFTEEEVRHINFYDTVEGKLSHTTEMGEGEAPEAGSVIGFYAQEIMKATHIFGCYDVLYGKVKEFVRDFLFGKMVNLEDALVIKNVSEPEANRVIAETFKKAVNGLVIKERPNVGVEKWLALSETRPFAVTQNAYFLPKKSIFNKVIGDSDLEIDFAQFLDNAPDVAAFAKNYEQIYFRIDYRNADGALARYIPDFFVRTSDGTVYLVETKGREDFDDPLKFARLQQWCADATANSGNAYKALYVKQEDWEKYRPKAFKDLEK